MKSVLTAAVDEFVEALAPEVRRLAGATATDHVEQDLNVEALNIACALIAVDDRDTDVELLQLIACFGPRLQPSLMISSPAELRDGYMDNREFWLAKPSPLFMLLVDADRRDNTKSARTYYDKAVHLAHAVSALDAVPSDVELQAIEDFRSNMLNLLRTAQTVSKPVESPTSTEAEGESESIDDLLAELDALVGLDGVKREVKLVTNLLQVQSLRKQHDLPVIETSRHLVFTGNPGTGKTTVARLLARIYRVLKVVDKGQLVETDRSGLVVGYVGQTATKTTEVFKSAIGGVLLIDEAYALARGDDHDFGQESIDTLVKLIEDHRDDIAVIVAGYPEEMHGFIESNPGLRSRFPKTIAFADYSTEELVSIFKYMTDKSKYAYDEAVLHAVRRILDAHPRGKGFGNARVARNLFETAVANHANRVVLVERPTQEQLMLLTPEDIGT